jgi:hypothetical protein
LCLWDNVGMAAIRTTNKPFTDWDAEFIKGLAVNSLNETAKKALKFYNGDHWQDGQAWKGPVPDVNTCGADDYARFMNAIMQSFTSSNVVKEVADRHVSAVIGRSPAWQMVPKNAAVGQHDGGNSGGEEDTATHEIEAAITEWMDSRNVMQNLKAAASAMVTTGRGYLRVFIPTGLLLDGVVPRVTTPAEALQYLYLEDVDASMAGVVLQRSTMRPASYTVITTADAAKDGSTSTIIEVQFTDPANPKNLVMRTWVDAEQMQEAVIPAGEILLGHEMRREPIITKQVMELQGGLNFALTAMGRNNGSAGFLERVIMNAQPPGEYVKEGTKEVFKPAKYQGGPGSTTFLMGQPFYDETGQIKGYTTPNFERHEPSAPDSFTASMEAYRHAIYMEAKQGHLLVQNDGNASAASRIQLRADFAASLGDTKNELEAAMRWLLGTITTLAGIFMGQPTKFADLRPTVQATIDTGPLSDAERSAILEQLDKGVRSRETAMGMLGIEDPDAEASRIATEASTRPISLEELALFGVQLDVQQQAALMVRAGVGFEDMQALVAAYEQKQQERAAAEAARQRLNNPNSA